TTPIELYTLSLHDALPIFPGVGISQVSVQGVTGDFIVETKAVVPYRAGAGLAEGFVDLSDEFRFGETVLQRLLGRNTGNQTGFWGRQVVVRRLAVNHQRIFDHVQIRIRTNPGKLRGAVVQRVNAKGFVIVPVKRADQEKTPALWIKCRSLAKSKQVVTHIHLMST